MYGFHNFETATKLAEQKTNETGQQHCVLHAEDVDGPGGMFTLGVYLTSPEISARDLIDKIMRTLGRCGASLRSGKARTGVAAREHAQMPNRQ
jgi:hypothetical protein